jgi:type VI secretion system protein ImpG
MSFSCNDKQSQSSTIPSGSFFPSRQVDGIELTYGTCFDTMVHPMTITDVVYSEKPAAFPEITLSLKMNGTSAEFLNFDSLRLFLGNSFRDAADLYQALMTNLNCVTLRYRETLEFVFLPDALKAGGFGDEEKLVPYPSNSFPGYRLLQEYFQFPEKFLFIDLSGWEAWSDRSNVETFDLVFQLTKPLANPLRINKKSLVAGVTPAVNIFPKSASPVSLDHTLAEYHISPSDGMPSQYQIYSVDRISGYSTGTGKDLVFQPFYRCSSSGNHPVYDEKIKKSPIREAVEYYISVAYTKDGKLPDCNTLSIDLSCTNAFLPEWLSKGDISNRDDVTTEGILFENISKPTIPSLPSLGSNALWRLLSLLSLNTQSLADVDSIKTLLKLFVMEDTRDKKRLRATEKRIDGILHVDTAHEERIVHGIPMRGMKINVKAASDHFAGQGDLYLFGTVLSRFFSLYASMNTFTRLTITDTTTGDSFSWAARIGNQLLI